MADKALAAKIREAGEYLIKKSEELAHEDVEILDIRIDLEKNELDGRWERPSYIMRYDYAYRDDYEEEEIEESESDKQEVELVCRKNPKTGFHEIGYWDVVNKKFVVVKGLADMV